MQNFNDYKKFRRLAELAYENNVNFDEIFEKIESGNYDEEQLTELAMSNIGQFAGGMAGKMVQGAKNFAQGAAQGYRNVNNPAAAATPAAAAATPAAAAAATPAAATNTTTATPSPAATISTNTATASANPTSAASANPTATGGANPQQKQTIASIQKQINVLSALMPKLGQQLQSLNL